MTLSTTLCIKTGEHNSWHKFTNFELGVRVPLVVRLPGPEGEASAGKTSKCLAELVDVYPTLAELAGAGTPSDVLDGTSLAPVFADPTVISIPNSKGTDNKALAYSQYPHTSEYDCPFYHRSSSGGIAGCSNSSLGGANGKSIATTASTAEWMGYSVRSQSWRYTAWVPGTSGAYVDNWDSPLVREELYEHQVDNGTDFNAMDEPSNYAYNTSAIYVAARKDMHAKAFAFFHDFLPPPPVGPSPSPSPSPPPPPGPPVPPGPAKAECAAAGGILSHDSKGTPAIACCAQSCGKCGGKDCPKLPGGKEACCSKEIIADGNSCKTSKAPCVVE